MARRAGHGVGALVGLVAVALLVAACGSGGDDAGGAGGEGGALPRYVPEHVPYGLPLAQVADPLRPPGAGEDGEEAVAHLAVAWTDDPDPLPDEGSRIIKLGTSEVEVPSLPPGAERIDAGPRVQQRGRWRGADWETDDGHSFALATVGLDEATFDQLLASLQGEGASEADLEVPPGFREVARLSWQAPPSAASTGPGGAGFAQVDPAGPGYAMVFSESPLGQAAHATVSVGRLDPSAAWLSAAALTPAPPVVGEVGGHRSYEHRTMPATERTPEMEAAMDADPELAKRWRHLEETVVLQWWDGDLAFTVTTSPAAEAHRMAESLQEVDEAAWQAFTATATVIEPPTQPPTTPAVPPTSEAPLQPTEPTGPTTTAVASDVPLPAPDPPRRPAVPPTTR